MIPDTNSTAPHRFTVWAPHLDRLVQFPFLALAGATVITIPLLLSSLHWIFSPLFVFQVFLSFKLDRALSSRLLAPPLGLVAGLSFIAFGLGLPMFAGAAEVQGFDPALLKMQIAALVGTPCTMIGYLGGRGRVPTNWCPPHTEPVFAMSSGPLFRVAAFLAFFDVVRVVVGWRTGSLDRGFAGEVILDQDIGLWTFTGIFGRWNNLWCFFIPILWRFSGALGRVALMGVFLFYGLIAFASGARGLLLYPVIFFLFGVYFFIDRPRFRPERWLLLLLPVFAFFIYAMDVFRNTSEFQNSRMTDLSSRLAATTAIRSEAKERGDFFFTTGRALLGVADNVVYENTPDPVPFAGGDDILPAVLWTLVPQKLAPNKPPLFDADSIVVSYTNMKFDRSASALSLTADCYRRFGWPAVPVGLALFGLILGLFTRWILFLSTRVSLLFGVVCLSLLIGGFQAGLASTVLQTWWIWAYDLPKHLIVTAVVVYGLSGGEMHGLNHYLSRLAIAARAGADRLSPNRALGPR